MNFKKLILFCGLVWFFKGWVDAYPLNAYTNSKSLLKNHSLSIDSLNQIITLNENTNPELAIEALNLKIGLLKGSANNKDLFASFMLKGGILRLQQKFKEAKEAFKQAERLTIVLKDNRLNARVFLNTGTIFVYEGEYLKALKNFFLALDILEQYDDRKSIELANSSIGSLFSVTRNYDLAFEYYHKVYQLLDSQPVKERPFGLLLNNMGWAQFQLGKLDEANQLYLRGTSILVSLNEWFFVVEAYRDLARIYLKLGRIEDARSYALKSLELTQQLNIKEGELESKIILANIMLGSNYDEVISLLSPYKKEIQSFNSVATKRDFFELLFKALKLKGDFSGALKVHEIYTKYNDTVNAEIYQFNIVSEHMKREYNLQMERARNKHELEKQEIRHSRLKLIMGVFLALILVSVVFFVVYQRSRQKSRFEIQQLYAEFEKLKLKASNQWTTIPSESFELNRDRIESFIDHRLNETDWKVLNVLLIDPMQSNLMIADKVHLSKDGLSSSLKRMYEFFDIKDSKYKKIDLITRVVSISNETA
jgi:tetratricopeptide (TPR) repeat protein